MKAIGIDIGTTSLCGTVLDAETGNAAETVAVPNESCLIGAHPWERLQDPDALFSSAHEMYRSLLKRHDIKAIGFTGQMHGILYLDSSSRAVSPLYTWQDGRGGLEYEPGQSFAARLRALTGYKTPAGYGMATHFYNLEQGLVPKAAAGFCTVGDYIAMRFARVSGPVTHVSNAAGIGLYDLQSGRFDEKAAEKAGLDASLFPAVTRDFQTLGRTESGIPVVSSVGDNQAGFIGSVRSMDDSILVNVGTGSQITLAAGRFLRERSMETRPLTGGSFLLVGSALCGGYAYALLEQFFRRVVSAAGFEIKSMYPVMDALAEGYKTIKEPLSVSTQLNGTHDDPDIRGKIEGLSAGNFTPAHFTAGILEGITRELSACYAALENPPAAVRLVGAGNGIRKNRALRRMFSEIFGLPMSVPGHTEEASYGAALSALVGTGALKSLPDAQRLIRYRAPETF